jgi:serine/threonine protein kinase
VKKGTTSVGKKQIESEIDLLQGLVHPSIIQFYGHFRGENDRLVFITEMMTSGTLKE